MAAFNTACRALATGECRAAIAGGVHVMSPISGPPAVMSLKLAGFLEPRGQCKPFMIDGAGFCRAEGAGLAVMKRLSDAIHDGDRIHGVIHGIGIGNMASVSSIVRPDGPLQCLSLGRAVACSGIDPSEIRFVEAHGPGTQKGDPAEVFSICSVLAKQGSRYPDNTLTIGSVKGNVGHSAAASGSMSLFKVLAMMRYQMIPPQPNFHPSMLNPRLRTFFEDHPIRISDYEQKWNAARRIAVVSNFGGTGYAGHIVVEDSATCVQPASSSHVSVPIFPFFISARDKKTLVTLAHRYADWLESEGASVALSDISYATTARREVHTYFALVQATSQADLARQLRNDETRPIIDASSLKHPRTLAFCFSGQGGPRLDPRKSSLYGVSSAFSSMVDTCFRISDSEKLVATEDVEALELFALQAGLAEMWISWGLTPVVLVGHSFGEYSVLVRAGILSIRNALKLVGIRAALVREKCTGVVSKMAALRLPLADVRGLLSQQTVTQVELACINSETQVTLAGTPKDLSSFYEEVLKVHPSARWQLIDNMRAAFHSRFVEPIREEFLTACQNVDFLPSKVTVLSGPLGRTCQPGDNALREKDYLVRHCRDTNYFGEAVRDYALHNEVDRLDWIELGAHSSTIGFIPLTSGQIKLPSQRKGEDGWTTTLNTLVKLRSAGHAVNFAAFHRDINPAAHHTDLPRYPFQLQPHVHPVRKANRSSSALVDKTIYPRVTSAELSPILKSHVVANISICPSSVYMSLALAACSNARKEPPAFRVSQLVMVAPFTGLKDDWLQVRKTAPSAFEIVSNGGRVHASMQAEMCNEPRLLETLGVFKHLVSSMRSIQTLPGTNIFDTRLAYDLFGQTVTYGPHCQGLRRVWITADGHQAWALSSNESHEAAHRLELEPTTLRAFSSTLIDRACQLIGFLINTSPDRGRDEIFVSTEIEHVEMTLSNLHDSVSFESYASFELSGREDATAVGQVFTFDQQQRLVAVFRGVRMRRMKQHIVEHLVRQASGVPASTKHASSKPAPGREPEETLVTPVLTPKSDEGSSNDQMRGTISAVFRTTLGIDHIPVDRKVRIYYVVALYHALTYLVIAG
jgi:acyl transferase domain-containing protein